MKIFRKITKGSQISYRERRQLKRTTLDVLRMIPFVFFIIVPFLEFLLPVALLIFPNMLPSAFRTELAKVLLHQIKPFVSLFFLAFVVCSSCFCLFLFV